MLGQSAPPGLLAFVSESRRNCPIAFTLPMPE
jgi:hypothetical protein